MSWLRTPEFKVGFLVITVSSLIGVMALKVAEGPGLLAGSRRYFFKAESAGGLVPNSAVKMAGIRIGIIDEIVLEEGRARIILKIENGPRITTSSTVELRADGILGDKHVELVPGKSEDPELPPGSEIQLAGGKGGLDDVMTQASQVLKTVQELANTFKDAVKQGDDTTSIGRIVGNIEKLTADLKEISGKNKDGIHEIIERVRTITKNIDTYINEDSLAHVDHALKNIDEVTTKINKGEGTLGRLVNDESTIENINTAVENINNFLGTAQKMETSVDFHSEFMTSDQNKSFLGVRIQPGLDRYYELAFISDSQGLVKQEIEEANKDGTTTTTAYRRTYKNEFKFTGLFAKNFWDLTIKGGIIESYGGVGLDYFVLGNRNLRASFEAFHFQDLELRAFLRYNFFHGFYVTGGGDNLLGNDRRPSSAFVGAGIFITNDDLKTLATKFSMSK
jgi:phospholipid/cholesterol/gamma-HCH transport system substrate-binding protein